MMEELISEGYRKVLPMIADEPPGFLLAVAWLI